MKTRVEGKTSVDVNSSGERSSPLVSVVVPTFGRPGLLNRALHSVISQTWSRWELIVVDDNDPGSAARSATERLMKGYLDDGRVHYLEHDTNRGGSQARNTGIAAAKGEYVAFLDDDDEWLPTKLEVQCRRLSGLPRSVAAVYCGYFVQSSTLAKVTEVPGRSFRRPYPMILVDNFIGTTSTLLCRRSAFGEIGMFDTELPAAQDRELLIRLCRSFELACVAEPLVRFNWHDGARITKQLGNKLEAQELLYARYAVDLRPHPGLHAKYLVAQAKLQLQCGQGRQASSTFLRAWRVDPIRVGPLFLSLLSAVDGSFYEWVRLTTWKLRRRAARAGRSR